eukprot:scaffold323390_cov24-Tisochrysis_lutea.AAC.1
MTSAPATSCSGMPSNPMDRSNPPSETSSGKQHVSSPHNSPRRAISTSCPTGMDRAARMRCAAEALRTRRMRRVAPHASTDAPSLQMRHGADVGHQRIDGGIQAKRGTPHPRAARRDEPEPLAPVPRDAATDKDELGWTRSRAADGTRDKSRGWPRLLSALVTNRAVMLLRAPSTPSFSSLPRPKKRSSSVHNAAGARFQSRLPSRSSPCALSASLPKTCDAP